MVTSSMNVIHLQDQCEVLWSSALESTAIGSREVYKDLGQDSKCVWLSTHNPDILECEVKWALRSITTNKASRGDGIPAELLQTLKDDAVKVPHSIGQQTWKSQQWQQV